MVTELGLEHDGSLDRLFRVSYDLTAETTKVYTRMGHVRSSVEGDTTEFVRALSRALVDVVVVHVEKPIYPNLVLN